MLKGAIRLTARETDALRPLALECVAIGRLMRRRLRASPRASIAGKFARRVRGVSGLSVAAS